MKRLIPLFLLLLLIFTGCSSESASIHTVIFDDGYGNTFEQDVKDGKTATKPYKNPTAPSDAKKGRFNAWVTKSDSGAETEYDFSQPVKRDLHLYATYLDAYTVNFFKNRTDLYTDQSVSTGDRASKPAEDPEDPDKGSLIGWATDPDRPEETTYDFNTPVTENLNLYAYYRAAKYVTLLDPDGKQIGKKIKVDYGDLFPTPELKECGSRLIEKWQVKNGENYEDYDFSLPVETDITLKAVCYNDIKASLTQEEVLSAMRFAEVLAPMKGSEKGEDTTAGFRNSDLMKLFLAGSHGIDPETLNFRYPHNGVYYELYVPGESMNVPENILYYEISSDTVAKRYNRNYEDGVTEITAEDFVIIVRMAKGRIEDGRIVRDGEYFDLPISLTLRTVTLNLDKSGNIDIVFEAGSRRYYFTMTNESTDKSTVSTMILKKTDYQDSTKSGTGAENVTFYNVTFDSNNGDEARKVKLIASEDGKATLRKPDLDPVDEDLNHSFKYWTKGGTEYDFSSQIGENTVLTAAYFTKEEYKKVLEAECIYKIPTLLSQYKMVFEGYKIVDERLFPETDAADRDMGMILLSSLFYIDPESEKLYLTYNGEKYIYEDNSDFKTLRVQGQSEIAANSSKKDGNISTIKIDGFKLTLQYVNNTGTGRTWENLTQTFSIDATITSSGTDGRTKVTTAVLTIGEKTYPKLTATATTLESGKTEVVFEYEGLRFTRVY